jgi:putative nucleotidyltransferase with HDIG domain
VRLARRLNVTDEAEIQALKAAALLHDVGKIGVPEHILNKPGRLTASEFEIMKRHAPMGADILSLIGFPYPVVPIVRHHHENWNGAGYPDGLAGEQIPIGARILSVVDCFDALTSDRPYRPRLSDEDAKAIVRDRRGTMYDPRIVDEFFAMQAEDAGEQVPVDEGPATPSTNPWATTAMAPTPTNGPDLVSETQVLQIFYRLGAEIAATMRVSDVGEIVWHHVSQCVPSCSFVMYMYDANSDALVPLFRSDERVIGRDARIRRGERLSGWVAAHAQTMINAEARLDQDPQLSDAHPLRSALATPVRQNGRIVGVMSFYAEELDAFSPLHRHIAEAAASCVSALPLESGSAEVAAATAA